MSSNIQVPPNSTKNVGTTTLNMLFNVTYYLELHKVIYIYIYNVDVISYQVKLLMLCNVQTINLTDVGKM